MSRPPRPDQILAERHPGDIERFLVLREALLAVPGVEERVVRDGRSWTLGFAAAGREVFRARLASRRAAAPALRLAMTVPGEWVDELAAAEELDDATRHRLRRTGETGVACVLPVAGEESLAEALGLALAIASRLAGMA